MGSPEAQIYLGSPEVAEGRGALLWSFRIVEGRVSRGDLVALGDWCAALVRQQVIAEGPALSRMSRRRRVDRGRTRAA